MNLCSISYVPRPGFLNSDEYLSNLRKFKTRYPVVLYSDYPEYKDMIRLKQPLESVKNDQNKWAVNNAGFYTGMRIAMEHGYSHALYLEADCRVGRDDWDAILFDEFFAVPRALCCAGTQGCYNPTNSGPEGFARWKQIVANNIDRNFRTPTWGWKGAADGSGSSTFVNGAGGIYDIEWMKDLFEGLQNTGPLAKMSTAWDFEIGNRLWAKLGHYAYDVVGDLKSIYSSYGDVITTEAERRRMLVEGECVLVHQIKSNWTP